MNYILILILLLFMNVLQISCTREKQSSNDIIVSEIDVLTFSDMSDKVSSEIEVLTQPDTKNINLLECDCKAVNNIVLSSDHFIVQHNSRRIAIYHNLVWNDVWLNALGELLLKEDLDNWGAGSNRGIFLYHFDGIQVGLFDQGRRPSIDKRVSHILVTNKNFRTFNEITVGSSLEEVIALYGPPHVDKPMEWYDERTIGFDPENDGIIGYYHTDPRNNSANERSLVLR